MKNWKKVIIILSVVAVLFVSVFAVTSSALDLSEYIQADPQNTLCAVNSDQNIISGAVYALPSFVIPPENSSGAYLTFGNMNGIKYRWQWYSGDNARFGIHSVSHYTQYVFQNFNYLDIRGVELGGFDVSVRSNFGAYDGYFGVDTSTGSARSDSVDIIIDFVYTSDFQNFEAVRLSKYALRSDKLYYVSDIIKEAGYIGNDQYQNVYLKSIAVRSGNYSFSGNSSYANELLLMLHTDGYRYWEERQEWETNSFTPEIEEIIGNVRYHSMNIGYYNGYEEGIENGYQSGYTEAYNKFETQLETLDSVIKERDEAREGLSNSNAVLNFFQGVYDCINGVLQTFFQLDVFGISLGNVICVFAIALVAIFVIKIIV